MPFNFYRCKKCGNVVCLKSAPDRCHNCRSAESGLEDYSLYEEIEP